MIDPSRALRVQFQPSVLWGCLPPSQVSYWQTSVMKWVDLNQFHLSWLLLTSGKLFKFFFMVPQLRMRRFRNTGLPAAFYFHFSPRTISSLRFG